MNTFYDILVHTHSGLRWIVLLLLLTAIVRMHIGWKGRQEFTDKDRKLGIITMMAFHTQFLIGIILYFISDWVVFSDQMMGNKLLRFYTLEHFLIMSIAMALITVGYSKAKKADLSEKKFRFLAIFFTIATLLVLVGIPWPFREGLMGHWF